MKETKKEKGKLPFISVLLPTYNQSDSLDKTLSLLANQTYPKDRFEIIVIDNGSTDHTLAVIQKHDVILLEQLKVKSPYVSKNKGFRHSKGEIIACIDSSCFPIKTWMEAGVKSLLNEEADVIAGFIQCDYKLGNVPEMTDALLFVNTKSGVKRGAVPGGNVFSWRSVFDKVGLFDKDLRSGGDSVWSEKVVNAGFKIIYSEDAMAIRKPKNSRTLISKAYRIGKTNYLTRVRRSRKLTTYIMYTISLFLPPKMKMITQLISDRNMNNLSPYLKDIWWFTWKVRVNMGIGRLNLSYATVYKAFSGSLFITVILIHYFFIA